MIRYDFKQNGNIAETISFLISKNNSADLFAVDINWTEDGTQEYSNTGGEVFLFADKRRDSEIVDKFFLTFGIAIVTNATVSLISRTASNT